MVHNELEVVLKNPSVTLFPVTAVGRPLASVEVRGARELAPGERWRFESQAVDARGVDVEAYPAGEIVR